MTAGFWNAISTILGYWQASEYVLIKSFGEFLAFFVLPGCHLPSCLYQVAPVPGKERVWLRCFTQITIISISTNLPYLTFCQCTPSHCPRHQPGGCSWLKGKWLHLFCNDNYTAQETVINKWRAICIFPMLAWVSTRWTIPCQESKVCDILWYDCNWGKSMPKNNCNFHFYWPFLTYMPKQLCRWTSWQKRVHCDCFVDMNNITTGLFHLTVLSHKSLGAQPGGHLGKKGVVWLKCCVRCMVTILISQKTVPTNDSHFVLLHWPCFVWHFCGVYNK